MAKFGMLLSAITRKPQYTKKQMADLKYENCNGWTSKITCGYGPYSYCRPPGQSADSIRKCPEPVPTWAAGSRYYYHWNLSSQRPAMRQNP
eukprot:770991-Pleurochrysis_carterae.AAC.1